MVDAVFLDLAMPGIDGWTPLRRLREQGFEHLPAAIVSANAFDEGLENELGTSAADFLTKPVRMNEVLVWVARGKTKRNIGDILGASPRTITKHMEHMEHILPKLGVETRTAGAGLVLTRILGFGQSRG